MEILNLEKISGYLLQNVLKVVTSLSNKKPCLTNHSMFNMTLTFININVMIILYYINFVSLGVYSQLINQLDLRAEDCPSMLHAKVKTSRNDVTHNLLEHMDVNR